jgi:diadenosine tetraphosphate (Ap4A) HIT family hydrolase
MSSDIFPRQPVTPEQQQAYLHLSQHGPCFICRLLAGDPAYAHHVIYADEIGVAFLNKYPTLYGYCLVAPRQHREQVTGDFTLAEYQSLQALVYRVAEAVRRVVPAERVYILSLGSQQGNRHVHWHIAPLPPGVPYAEQQFAALHPDRGFLQLSPAEMAGLAERLRQALDLG